MKEITDRLLYSAARSGDSAKIKELLLTDCEMDSTDVSGWTALMYAAYHGHFEIVKQLVEKGTDINAVNDQGFSVLIESIYKKRKRVIKYLIEKGADINHLDNDGNNALMYTLLQTGDLLYLIKLLIQKGADLTQINKDEQNALMLAVTQKNRMETTGFSDSSTQVSYSPLDVVKLLIEYRTPLNEKDLEGNTALKLAYLDGQHDVVEMLLRAGAKPEMDVLLPKDDSPNLNEIFDLTIRNENFKELSKERKNKWKELIKDTLNGTDTAGIIFLAEILELLDGKHPCKFICNSFTGYDMFGACDIHWKLTTGKYQIIRSLRRDISDSWQRVEEDENRVDVSGFPKGQGLEWNGETGGFLSKVEIKLLGIEENTKKALLALADEFCADGSHKQTNFRMVK